MQYSNWDLMRVETLNLLVMIFLRSPGYDWISGLSASTCPVFSTNILKSFSAGLLSNSSLLSLH